MRIDWDDDGTIIAWALGGMFFLLFLVGGILNIALTRHGGDVGTGVICILGAALMLGVILALTRFKA